MQQFSRVLSHDQCIGKTKHTSYKKVCWFRRRSFAILNSSVRFGTLIERHLHRILGSVHKAHRTNFQPLENLCGIYKVSRSNQTTTTVGKFRCVAIQSSVWTEQKFWMVPCERRLSKSPLFFSLVGYAILSFHSLFGGKFTGRKFYRWRHDNWPIGSERYFMPLPTQNLSIIVFPRKFIIWVKSI